MDLPTYTNIWRIEKRLYKLYDLRLPMPLPIVWIGVFVGVFVPWSLLLWLVGVPVQMPWHVLYLVPPGIVTWLSTRPVIEGKRLTELLESQLRYLGQPRAWYRLAPGAEPETISFSGRVWRASPARVRVKSTRKARQAQRKRSAAQRINGPRQVRPAVAAAAVAAAQAPVAEPAATRTGRDSRTRPGTAAPALGTTTLALPPSRQDQSPSRQDQEHEPVRESRAEARGAAETPAELRLVRDNSEDAPTGREEGEAERDDARHEPAGDAVERAGGRTSRQAAAGKPIDTEALRRLRKLAASADAPSESSALPGGEDERVADEHGRDDEVARNQHRKGQPPRLGPALLLPDTQRGWSPLNPDSTPVKISRPLRGKGPDSELPALPVHHDDAVPSASARPEQVDPAQHGDPTRAEPNDEDPQQAPTGSAHGDDTGSTPRTQEDDAPGRLQSVEGEPVGTSEGEEAPPAPSTGQEVPSETLRPLESLPSATRQPSERAESERAAEEHLRSVAPRQSGQRLRSVEPLRSAQDQEPDEQAESAEQQGHEQQGHEQQEREREQERSVVSLEAREESAVGSPVEERLRSVGRPQAPERRDGSAGVSERRDGAAGAPVPVPRPGEREPRVRRVESVVGRDSGGWRRIAQVVVGGSGVRTDGSEIDEARARGVFGGSRRIVVLGCTGGAGQSTTALMLGHTLARYRDDRVVAIDAATGGGSLTSRIEQETPETLTSLLAGLHGVSGYLTMRGFTTRTASGLEVVGADSDAEAEQRLADRDLFSDRRLGEALSLLDRHYKLTVIDPAASLAARVLPYADQLVLVLPASEEASEAVAMTYEWLDGHGCADLRRRAVMVVNGVSRRSMADVEQAEAVASGRCRAIVRVPWEDGLAPDGAEVVDPGQLRAAGRRAYLALAGVVVAGFAAQQIRPSEEELASDPPGTRIGER